MDRYPGTALLERIMLAYDKLSITENGHWDVFGPGTRAKFHLDEDIELDATLHGMRQRTYIIFPIELNGGKVQIGP